MEHIKKVHFFKHFHCMLEHVMMLWYPRTHFSDIKIIFETLNWI